MTGETPGEASTAMPPHLRRAIFFMAIAAFAAALTTRIMDAVLPQIAIEFHDTVGSVSFVASFYALAYGASQIVFGPVGDRHGKYRIIAMACAAGALTNAICAFSQTRWELGATRFLAGVATAGVLPLAIAWVGDKVDVRERQPVLAQFMSGQILGLLAGQLGGGVLGEFFGWRSIFVLASLLYVIALIGLLSQMRPARELVDSGSPTALPISRSLTIFGDLLRKPVVRFALAAISLEAFAMFGAFAFVSAKLHGEFGMGFASIGLYLSPYCLGGLFYVWRSRWLIQKMGRIRMAVTGTAIVAAGYVAIALAPSPTFLLPAIPVMGVGFYMVHNTLQAFATEMAPEARGAAVAIFATFYFLAQAVGVSLAGKVVDSFGFVPVFLTAAGMMLLLGAFLWRSTPPLLRHR